MSKDRLGSKHICESCGIKFYDLNKSPIVCPKCDHAVQPEVVVAKPPAAKEEPEKPAPETDEVESEDEDTVGLEDLLEDESDDDLDDDLAEEENIDDIENFEEDSFDEEEVEDETLPQVTSD